ncbi:MAG: hypothetical protein NUW37_10830 [Planctomycetes bacterium]|nr:hypothetical protein [Planctomycetota bacterium]
MNKFLTVAAIGLFLASCEDSTTDTTQNITIATWNEVTEPAPTANVAQTNIQEVSSSGSFMSGNADGFADIYTLTSSPKDDSSGDSLADRLLAGTLRGLGARGDRGSSRSQASSANTFETEVQSTDNGGTLSLSFQRDGTTGNFAVGGTFTNFQVGDYVLNGSANMSGYSDPNYIRWVAGDYEITELTNLGYTSVSDSTKSFNANGQIKFTVLENETATTHRDELTFNVTYDVNGKVWTFYDFDVTYAMQNSGGTVTETLAFDGSVDVPDIGIVKVTTPTEVTIQGTSGVTGGQIKYLGSTSSCYLTFLGGGQVQVDFDLGDDGTIDYTETVTSETVQAQFYTE